MISPLPFAIRPHLHTSFLDICTDCSLPNLQLHSLASLPPLVPDMICIAATANRCEEIFFNVVFPTPPTNRSMCFHSLYTFWPWWSRVASMYNKLLAFPDYWDVNQVHPIPGRIPLRSGAVS